ncbi:hypothetical protein VTO42DRAFT_8462 [Malbranchea cinnamomea]
MGDTCIPLTGSTACPAWANASITTNSAVISKFPFLEFVSNIQEFDDKIITYVRTEFVKQRYQQIIGCSDVDLSNTSYLYSRYATTVVCNGIVQESKGPCNVPEEFSRPLCADSCAEAATSEEIIVHNEDLCGTPRDDFMDDIRSYFTVCASPADALSGECVPGSANEAAECGFGPNLWGLCGYCAESSPNATDSCCAASDATHRCTNVDLPTVSLPPLFPTDTSTSTPDSAGGGGLSGGQIAGIVVGAVAGLVLIGALLGFLIIFMRRRRRGNDNMLNQPSPQHRGPGTAATMQQAPGSKGKNGNVNPAPGGRVARMSALQSGYDDSPPRAIGAAAKFDSPDSERTPGNSSKRGPPITSRRNGSLSSTSVLAGDGDAMSPNSGSGGQFSSPEGVTSGQSEQLPYFRDYYSEDDIHPNDKVAVLWAYQPRAADEFELERGDMLRVVGIWDDGWATGVRLNERAEDYDGVYRPQRDSGVSDGSGRRGSSPPPTGELKAFPLVCVCLPQHWRKTIEGDGHDGYGPASPPR